VRITDAPSNADKIIDVICIEIDNARERITSEASWDALAQFFYEALLGRRTLAAAAVLAWADAGHPAADRAVRRFGAEMLDQYREGELLAQVRGHLVKILARPFVPFPRGRHVVQNFMRDLWLPTLVQRVADGTGLPPTRSASAAQPSAAYLVSLAMKKKGVKLKERQINRHYWDRHKVAAALESSMPPVDPSTFKKNI
jgi:hypothetical protein